MKIGFNGRMHSPARAFELSDGGGYSPREGGERNSSFKPFSYGALLKTFSQLFRYVPPSTLDLDSS